MSGNGKTGPWSFDRGEWIDVLKRTWTRVGHHNTGLIAAGTAFYAFAAIVPLLAAIVLTYGLFATPETVRANIDALFGALPQEAAALISGQLVGVVETSEGAQGLGLVVALGIALYGASKGASSMVTALNIAYDEEERRGFVKLYALAIAMVVAAVALVLVAVGVTATLAFLASLIPEAPGVLLGAIRIFGYLLLGLLVVTAAACLYAFAPDHRQPRWTWLSPGALVATLLWLAGTAGFALYAANFGNYGATYGSLSAVVVLLTWLWLSAYAFLLGAELNAEIEKEGN